LLNSAKGWLTPLDIRDAIEENTASKDDETCIVIEQFLVRKRNIKVFTPVCKAEI